VLGISEVTVTSYGDHNRNRLVNRPNDICPQAHEAERPNTMMVLYQCIGLRHFRIQIYICRNKCVSNDSHYDSRV